MAFDPAPASRSKIEQDAMRQEYSKWRASEKFGIWLSERRKLQLNKCYYCYARLRTGAWEVDHKIPIVKGGDNRYGNLCLSCRECNNFKNKHRLIPDKRTKRIRNRERRLSDSLMIAGIINQILDEECREAIERDN